MITVVMAAKHHICGFPERLQTWYVSILIGIDYERVAVALNLETGMSYPCYQILNPCSVKIRCRETFSLSLT